MRPMAGRSCPREELKINDGEGSEIGTEIDEIGVLFTGVVDLKLWSELNTDWADFGVNRIVWSRGVQIGVKHESTWPEVTGI